MNPIERYNNIINSIEDMIEENPNKKTNEIMNDLMFRFGVTTRDLAVVIKFFANIPLAEYVRKRKMNYSYKKLKEQEKYDLDSVIDFTGYADHSAYSKAFKKEFGMSPKKAYCEEKQLSNPPLTMEVLYKNNVEIAPYIDTNEDNLFGVDQNTYYNIIEASDLKELYGFNEKQANIAFNLYKKNQDVEDDYKISLDIAFEWIAEDINAVEEITGINTKNISENRIKELCDAWENVNDSFDGTVPTSQVIRLCCRAIKENIKLEDIDDAFGEYYMTTNVSLEEYIYGYKVYLKHREELNLDDIDEYFENLHWMEPENCIEYVKDMGSAYAYDYNEAYEEISMQEYVMEMESEARESKDIYGNEVTEDYDPLDPFDEYKDINDPEYAYKIMYRDEPVIDSEDDEYFYDNEDDYDDEEYK